MKKSPKRLKEPNIPVYKVTFPITSAEATLSVAGDFHIGMRGCKEDEIIQILTGKRKDVFRIWTGDLVENSLKTSVGHNYDIEIPDPEEQKEGAKKVVKKVMEYQLGGIKNWEKHKAPTKENHEDAKSVGVGGNHEYRTRKLTGQWLDKEIYNHGKVLPLGMDGVLELNILNKRLKISKIYRIYISHAPGKTNATSIESILRAFRKKQSSLPGIDIIIFGHYHKRFIQSDGYFDIKTDSFKKVIYAINPSPLKRVEYATEAGYPLVGNGCSIELYLPLDPDKQPYGII